MPKSSKDEIRGCHCGGCFFHDWFYAIMIILVGFTLLAVNLHLLNAAVLTYWPIILILIGAKELLERD